VIVLGRKSLNCMFFSGPSQLNKHNVNMTGGQEDSTFYVCTSSSDAGSYPVCSLYDLYL